MSIQFNNFIKGKKIRFKKDYFDRGSFAIEEPLPHPTPANNGDTGFVKNVVDNLVKIELDKGGYVRLFKSTADKTEPWETDDIIEIIK